ncbi:hypothetical protein CHGG_04235 [Chaetomium globosum CBS 148.51]|uniref:Uncharacterized protein n=1 Tax=Chaetomium globosum (strain ATCC 6205 / CBS 148.51 / DSM 1962 / NBRC 6347 / NRRL 1970) TaxID=306901 RepID=Q2H1W1_CHAGB|nr:uncharacterized protein CHGG_04235 [Chaetomium globosum CBS 148.51]EAQ87616.1 hypothetical protein CHGG_04235 [Chaetomium globosum CBS 148.51]
MTTRMPNMRREFQNASTPSPISTPATPTSAATITTGPGDGSSSEDKPTGTQTTTRVRIGDKPQFGQPGYHTETITLSTESSTTSQPILFNPLPEQHGHDGPVTVVSTIHTEVVATITKQTTLPGVVTTITSQTTSEVRTLDGSVSEYTVTSTLHGSIIGLEPSYTTAEVATLTNSDGTPTAIVTRTPAAVSTPVVLTLTDPDGKPTATVTTCVLVPTRTRVLTNTAGAATATITEYPIPATQPPDPQTGVKVYYISEGEYFVGFFLPTLLAVMLTIPLRTIDLAAKQLQPWHALTRHRSASARDSLCLRTGGMHGVVASVRSLAGGQVLVFLTTLLLLAAVLLVPLSSEAVALKLHGSCSRLDFRGCAMTLGVFLGPARATIGVLGFMVVLLLLILFVLRRWQTGVAANPWSIAAVASLSTNPGLRAVFSSLSTGRGEKIDHRQLVAALEGKRFELGSFFNRYGVPDYGVMVQEADASLWKVDSESSLSLKSPQESEVTETHRKTEHHLPFLMLSYTARAVCLVTITGIMVLILYYNNTGGDTGFERFMGTQNFGVRALFTLAGVGVSFFWSCFFTSLAVLSPYQMLSQPPQPPQRTITVSPPLNAFSGIVGAVQQRHEFLILVAFTAILSEFMPIVLSNVPFRVTQTWMTSRVCTWMAVGILSLMWLVVVGTFFVRWPHMPVDPSTIAGAMYYVCDSWMLGSMEGLSRLESEERDKRIAELGLRFQFGDIVGIPQANYQDTRTPGTAGQRVHVHTSKR